MSDMEPSTEAVVAGEAATAAVEEVHAREEVVDAAESASLASLEALAESAESRAIAESAEDAAVNAAVSADAAREVAETASIEAEQRDEAIAYATAEAMASHAQQTDEKLREMREYIDAHIPLPTPTGDDGVNEVDVNDGTIPVRSDRDSEGGKPSEDSAETGAEGSPGTQKRYGLRHRRK